MMRRRRRFRLRLRTRSEKVEESGLSGFSLRDFALCVLRWEGNARLERIWSNFFWASKEFNAWST
jgi:hypothetical protein